MSDTGPDPQKLLIVEPRVAARAWLAALAAEFGCMHAEADAAEQARLHLAASEFDVVLLSHELPARERIALRREIRSLRPDLPIVELAESASPRTIVDSLRSGTVDFLVFPPDADELASALGRCARWRAQARRSSGNARSGAFAVAGEKMGAVLRRVDAVARTDLTVLIRGESGTGKELVARALWAGSPRRGRPFVKICCAAIPEELLESELFGFERAGFTGAGSRRAGRIQSADRGTLFLDEVGELSPRMQAKLLQLMQDGRFRRLGSEGESPVDARVIAATGRDLDGAVASGLFRDDLYYRLNVVSLRIPPLRERPEEIIPLAVHFASRSAREYGRDVPELGVELRWFLRAYHWPGNVRELENLIKRLVVLGNERSALGELRARVDDVPVRHAAGPLERFLAGETPTLNLKEVARAAARHAEATYLARVLEEADWNRERAAAILQLSPKALLNRMRDAGLGPAPTTA